MENEMHVDYEDGMDLRNIPVKDWPTKHLEGYKGFLTGLKGIPGMKGIVLESLDEEIKMVDALIVERA